MRIIMFIVIGAYCLITSCKKTNSINVVSIDHPYKFPQEIADELEKDSNPWKHEPAAWAYSRIGEYEKALVQWDLSRKTLATEFGILLHGDTIDSATFFDEHHAVPSQERILKRAAEHQVLLINEGHHLPNHRVFTASLLLELWNLGYRRIGFEAIIDDLATMHQEGYPTYGLGTYTEEPQFGELIREALTIGYKIFGYDSDDLYDEDREIYQAKTIASVITDNPDEKTIIHCGFGHLYENPNNRLMGYQLGQLTNLDPLTVNQYHYSERYSTLYEHQVYTDLVTDESVVFMSNAGEDFGRPNGDSINEDLLVFHPRTKYKDSRPTWLEDDDRSLTKIELPDSDIDCPCLVMAINADESMDRAVPIDVIHIHDYSDDVYLSLKKGHFNIVVQNQGKRGISFSSNRT